MAASVQLPGVSFSCGATVGTAAYVLLALFNLYRMMNPLVGINLATVYPPMETPYVPPIWNLSRSKEGKDEYLGLLVYISHLDKFTLDFLNDDGGEEDEDKKAAAKAAVLLWDNPSIPASALTSPASMDDSLLHKSIILTTREHFQTSNGTSCSSSGGDAAFCCPISERILSSHLSQTIVQEIGTSSFFIRFVEWIQHMWKSFYQWLVTDVATTTNGVSKSSNLTASSKNYSIVQLDQKGPIWRAMMNNQTIYLHVLVTKNKRSSTKKHHEGESIRASSQQKKQELISFSQKYSLLMGSVPLVKFDEPVPRKPTRILINDILYLYQRYVQQTIPPTVSPPWDLLKAASDSNAGRKVTNEYLLYQKTLQDKRAGVTYPYFKPEVAIKIVSDTTVYPLPIALHTGLDVVQRQGGTNNYGYLPSLYVDEIGLTSEKYLHLNHTITDVPLRITLDTLSPQRHRLMSVLESRCVTLFYCRL
jgi:hypothetical protein